MKNNRFLAFFTLTLSASLLAGCSTLVQTNAEIDKGVHAPKRSMDMARALKTDSNISNINQALSIVKSTNEDKAPATLEEAKAAAKLPADVWIDADTKLPLEYDPVSGTVHRVGAAANSAPHAGAQGAPGRINIPGGGGF